MRVLFLLTMFFVSSVGLATALTDGHKDLLNRMNSIARKVELGDKLQDALTVTATELSVTANKTIVGSSLGVGSEVDPKFLAIGTFTFSDQPLDGAATLLATASIPDNAVIQDCWIDVITTFTSDDTTPDDTSLGIGVEGVGAGSEDLVNAAKIRTATDWDSGFHACIPVGTAATMIKTTAAKNITVNVVNGAGVTDGLTAGKLKVYVEYSISE